ncbi:MAG: peptidoglycan-associated lipoprotein Pal [Aestuariivirga sp.]|uniref:peptidoglycan-associated lipoprotein Pal n=1 Tax=Aestuariivirga sp. TaxID=2650926 RepID=UPI0038D1CD49
MGRMDKNRRRVFTAAAGLASLLALTACSKKSTDRQAGTGPGAAAMPGSEQAFTVNVGDRVFFAEDKSTLSPEAQETLRRQAQWLQKYPAVTVQVEGHADERGTREYNIALSARRATATRDFLLAEGVAASRVSSIAYGKERPAALCDAEQCWSQNRRAVTVITGGAKTA